MPDPQVLPRPLISKDNRKGVYKITDNKAREGSNTKTVIVRRFCTTIFCSAESIFDEQERTRLVFLSPSDDEEKIYTYTRQLKFNDYLR